MKGARFTTGGLPSVLQAFFLQRLIRDRGVSDCTVAAYRDAFRLLLPFMARDRRRPPERLDLDDLSAPLVVRFLDDLEDRRGNSVRTRNLRLAAIRSFMRYAASTDPACLAVAQRVLAVPFKRHDVPLLGFLSRLEVDAVLAAPDAETSSGRRDRALFATLYNTGARVSEITGMAVQDLRVASESSVRIRGKGRKERLVPLWKSTARQLRAWLKEIDRGPESPLFPNRLARPITRSGVAHRLRLAVAAAVVAVPALKGRRISPHTFRHTTAMHLLQAGVDVNVIALWLGHESPETTHHYLEADLEMKRSAIARVESPVVRAHRFVPSDKLLDFLDGL